MSTSPETDWAHHQEFESQWWGDCTKTLGEEVKQLTYAKYMGLTMSPHGGQWPVYDMQGKSVLDIGGGPVSMLLKTVNADVLAVVDPCPYPDWVRARYDQAGILYIEGKGEAISTNFYFDEVWIYNVLQHVDDPREILHRARCIAPLLRIFEWIDFPPHEGHPHELKEGSLNVWIGGIGSTVRLDGENGCVGRAYYGVFSDLD